jgi:hypothetical protein
MRLVNRPTVVVSRVLLSTAVRDCLFLSLIMVLSAGLYVRGLGFYSDHWEWLASLSLSVDQSFAGLYESINYPHSRMRPVEVLHFAGLYWLFGTEPGGYHLTNVFMHTSIVVLSYLVLSALGMRRVVALAVPVIYGLLPHYSTDRFWSFATNLSVALYFLSLYCDLRVLRARLVPLVGWRLLGVFSLLGSTLGKEVILPLFFLNPLLVWFRERQLCGSPRDQGPTRASLALLILPNLLVLLSVITFKVLTTTRLGNEPLIDRTVRIARRAVALDPGAYEGGLNVKRAIEVNYGELGVDLPRVAWSILQDHPDRRVVALGVVVGVLVFGYLYRVVSASRIGLPSPGAMLRLSGMGLIVFGLGYAIFLTNDNLVLTTTGQNNRNSIAAAIGVACSFVGVVGWFSTRVPSEPWRNRIFCLVVALVCATGFLMVNTLASFWVRAAHEQHLILADVRERFPTLPSGTTLVLDGLCPYVGPAPVFEHQWDFKGALHLGYRDVTLRGDVVTPRLVVGDQWLSSRTYDEEERYPYGDILVYHLGLRTNHRLTDSETARAYFQTFNLDRSSGCPMGQEGNGVRLPWW